MSVRLILVLILSPLPPHPWLMDAWWLTMGRRWWWILGVSPTLRGKVLRILKARASGAFGVALARSRWLMTAPPGRGSEGEAETSPPSLL